MVHPERVVVALDRYYLYRTHFHLVVTITTPHQTYREVIVTPDGLSPAQLREHLETTFNQHLSECPLNIWVTLSPWGHLMFELTSDVPEALTATQWRLDVMETLAEVTA